MDGAVEGVGVGEGPMRQVMGLQRQTGFRPFAALPERFPIRKALRETAVFLLKDTGIIHATCFVAETPSIWADSG